MADKAIVGHNVTSFDLPWLWSIYGLRVEHDKGTLSADRLLTNGMREPDGTDTKSKLGVVAKRYLDLDLPKDQGDSDWGVPELTLNSSHMPPMTFPFTCTIAGPGNGGRCREAR